MIMERGTEWLSLLHHFHLGDLDYSESAETMTMTTMTATMTMAMLTWGGSHWLLARWVESASMKSGWIMDMALLITGRSQRGSCENGKSRLMMS